MYFIHYAEHAQKNISVKFSQAQACDTMTVKMNSLISLHVKNDSFLGGGGVLSAYKKEHGKFSMKL